MSSRFQLKNPHLNEDDVLYHLGLTARDDLRSQFGDVKFICTGGKPSRMKTMAEELYEKMGQPESSIIDNDKNPRDIAGSAGRYSMFKVGPVLLFSHGIGMASLSVVLNEVLKVLHFAECSEDVKVIRLGTSGGIGVDPGTVVVTNQPFNSALERKFRHVSLGEEYSLPCPTSYELRSKLLMAAKKLNIRAISGNTMSTDDFYEGQCRLDGAFCDYRNEDKMDFLKTAHDKYGIRNFEMESACLAAMCHRAGVECAVICTTLLNRLKGDAVVVTKEEINKWEDDLFKVVEEYIQQDLDNQS